MTRKGGSPQQPMTLRTHLIELRNRLFIVAGVLIVASTVAYMYRQPFISLLLSPLDGRQLQYLTPGGGFGFIFGVVFYAGFAAAIPILVQQAYAFMSPVISAKVRKRGGWLLFWSFVLLSIGLAFGFMYAVPGALNFLYGFANEFVTSGLTAESYLDFIVKYTLGIGMVFQIPLIMIIIHWIKPQKPLKLLKFERWVILIAFILAAVITPTPDPVNQTIIAVPIIAVYQIGFMLVLYNVWSERRKEKKQAKRLERAQRKAAKTKPVITPVAKPRTTSASAAQSTADEIARQLQLEMGITPTEPEKQPYAPMLPSIQSRPRRSVDGMMLRRPLAQRSAPHHPSAERVAPKLADAPRPVPRIPRPQHTVYLDGVSPMMAS